MWCIGNRLIWYSALLMWGKFGMVSETGPAIKAPQRQAVRVARGTDKAFWDKKAEGGVTAHDARTLTPNVKVKVTEASTTKQRTHHHSHGQHDNGLEKQLPKTRPEPPTKGAFRLSLPIPGARVGSGYGWRLGPISGKMVFHRGLDYGARFGTPVLAAAGGIVWRTGWMGSCGLGVVIVHRKGFTTCYCHLSHILAPHRSRVKRGQMIGRVGSTGSSTSPHLHFSVLRNRRFVDPVPLLSSAP